LSKPKIVSFLGFPREFVSAQFKERAGEYQIIHGGARNEISAEETKEYLKDAEVALGFPEGDAGGGREPEALPVLVRGVR
jgi:hypothetical protein